MPQRLGHFASLLLNSVILVRAAGSYRSRPSIQLDRSLENVLRKKLLRNSPRREYC